MQYKEQIAGLVTTIINNVVRNFSVAEIHELTLAQNNNLVATCLWGNEMELLESHDAFTKLHLYAGSEAMCYFYRTEHALLPNEVSVSGKAPDGSAFTLKSRINAMIAPMAA